MASSKDYKLELVQVLFRHGARTNSKSEIEIPMPQYIDHSLTEIYGYEQLTNIGKAQMHRFGVLLRDHYREFLGPGYRAEEVYAYSSDHDRTKMSLQLVLAGLYPPAAHQTWSSELNWLPVPFHYAQRELDFLLKGMEKPSYRKLLQDVLLSAEMKKINPEVMKWNGFFLKQGVTAIQERRFPGCMGIYNVLACHKAANGKLPHWYSDEIYDALRNLLVKYFDVLSMTTEMKKLNVGFLIKRMLENMNVKNEMVNPRKIYLYSGHDLNVAAFVRASDVRNFKYCEFGSAVIVEKLRDSNDQLYVRMLGWDGSSDRFTTLHIENCTDTCPIERYLKIVEPVIPSDDEVRALFREIPFDDLQTIQTTDFVFRPKFNP